MSVCPQECAPQIFGGIPWPTLFLICALGLVGAGIIALWVGKERKL